MCSEKTICGLSLCIFLIIYSTLYLTKPVFITKKNFYDETILDSNKLLGWSIFITSLLGLSSLIIYSKKRSNRTFLKNRTYTNLI